MLRRSISRLMIATPAKMVSARAKTLIAARPVSLSTRSIVVLVTSVKMIELSTTTSAKRKSE